MATMTAVGLCPGRRTGESDVQAMARVLKEYPDATAWRIFFNRPLKPSDWTAGQLAMVPKDRDVIVSYKLPEPAKGESDTDLPAFLAARPADRTGYDIIVPMHEPEQAEGEDPSEAEWFAEWERVADSMAGHPLLVDGTVRFGPAFTLQNARRVTQPGTPTSPRQNDWRRWWSEDMARVVSIILGDWYPYDPADTTPFDVNRREPPDTALAIMEEMCAETGVQEWGIAEWNHERLPDDPDGQLAAAHMGETIDWAADHGCVVWTHFHKGGGDLTAPSAPRIPERDMLRAKTSASLAYRANPDPTPPPPPPGPTYADGLREGEVIGFDKGRAAVGVAVRHAVTQLKEVTAGLESALGSAGGTHARGR